MSYGIYEIAWFFLIYSVVGWIVEVAYVTLTSGKVVNRGFLNGPVCPIYGFGMVGVLLALTPVADDLFILFVGGALLCTTVEFIGGWALDKLFHMRWWDYTTYPFNLFGYVCLGYSVMWGIGVLVAVRLVHPMFQSAIDAVPQNIGIIPMGCLYAVYGIDFVVSLKTVIGISKSIRELEKVAEKLHKLGDSMSGYVGGAVLETENVIEETKQQLEETKQKITETSERITNSGRELIEEIEKRKDAVESELNRRKQAVSQELSKSKEELEKRYRELREMVVASRIYRAFPNLKNAVVFVKLSEELSKIKQSISDHDNRG